jgi:type VI protein secretion system component VasK
VKKLFPVIFTIIVMGFFFVLTVVAFNFIPIGVRDWLAIIGLPLTVLYFLYAWYRWHRRQVRDANELEYLDELVQEHEAGTRDHRARLEHLLRAIEKEHKEDEPSVELVMRL